MILIKIIKMAVSDLKNLEELVVAGSAIKEKPEVSLAILKDHYDKKQGKDGRPYSEDYIIGHALAESAAGLEQGTGLNAGLVNALKGYSMEYVKALNQTTVADIIGYAKGYGHEGIPAELNPVVSRFADRTIEEVAKAAKGDKEEEIKPDEDAQRVEKAMQVLLGYVNKSVLERINSKYNLISLAPKQEKSDKGEELAKAA